MNAAIDVLNKRVFLYEYELGALLISGTDEFVESILFLKSDDEARRNSFEKSSSASGPVRQCISQLDEYFAGKRRIFDFPFRQPGTDFQQSVWNELVKIPYGQSISYLELARRLGNPKSIRAVGTTNGKNQLSIVVPCHRVIGSNGSLVGYGGELWRKKWLLENEAKWAHGVQNLF